MKSTCTSFFQVKSTSLNFSTCMSMFCCLLQVKQVTPWSHILMKPTVNKVKKGSRSPFDIKLTYSTAWSHMHIDRGFHEVDAREVHEVCPCVHFRKNEPSTRRNRDETQEIDHFTVVGLVTWLLNGSEAGVDLVLIQTSLLLLCKSSCYANQFAFTREKQRGLYQSKVTSSLACIHGQVTKHTTVKWPIACSPITASSCS